LKKYWDSLKALKQSNLWIGQIPHILRNMRTWWRITKNFRELEGSWPGAIRRYNHLFTGRPRKNDRFW